MLKLSRLFSWLTLRSANPDLVMAQYGHLRRQTPWLYVILIVNSVAIAYTHFDVAPSVMTVWIPGALAVLSLLRLTYWLKKPDHTKSAEDVIRLLRQTIVLGALLASVYIAWALGFSQYGGENEQAKMAIFIAVPVIGCILCLMHLPQAAVIVAFLVTVPYSAYYIYHGGATFVASGIDIVLITTVMIWVLLNNFRGFERLVCSETETQRLNREVTLLAHSDPLTRLPNRRLFFADLTNSMDLLTIGEDISVGIIDLDRFNVVNDTFGHLVGDQLLQAVGDRIRLALGPDKLVARIGGDEFAFRLDLDGKAAVSLANRACELLSEPFRLGDVRVTIGASCGIASSSDAEAGAMSIYDRADYALYRAKSERRGFAMLYSSEHEKHIKSELAVEAALQAADLESEMDVHLQPIVIGNGGVITAVEALARWNSPTLGAVRPDVFIPLAERTGIIHRLTLTLLQKALRYLERLPSNIKLSFNLSAHDLTCSETVLGIIRAINRSKIEPSRLILELTETAVMRDFDTAEGSIRLMRDLGLTIALDDFGTGHSSLSYLHRLPIDEVKIDRSFIIGSSDASGRQLLGAIVALCASLNMDCIAEGVESKEQFDILRGLGCNTFQGYLFAKPMSMDDLEGWLTVKRAA